MPQSLYNRVGQRFPSDVYQGGVSQGQLDSQGNPQAVWERQNRNLPFARNLQTLHGFPAEGPPPPNYELLELEVGLSGEIVDPDQTPGYGPGTLRTHAAPFPGWAPNYGAPYAGDYDAEQLAQLNENSRRIHGTRFTRPRRQVPHNSPMQTDTEVDQWEAGADHSLPYGQVELQGAQRVLGGYDAAQGYGGGGKGPGGTNNGADYKSRTQVHGNVINTYLDPAERPFHVPQYSGTFMPTDAVQGPDPTGNPYDAWSVSYNDPSSYAPPAEPATLSSTLVEAPVGGGW